MQTLSTVAARQDRPLDLLIVDDSRLQRRILEASLSVEGNTIRSAGSVARALDLCAERLPDIVISDWEMPERSGLDLCCLLRETYPDDYVYFIILTSKSEKSDLAEALSRGADDFLTKPVSGQELTGRLAAGARLLRMSRELHEKNRLISATLDRMRELNTSLDRDLAEARRLQMSLAPTAPIRFGDWTVSFMLDPAGDVGGDLVGAFPLTATRLGLFALDVSGHGIASALITARLSSWLSGVTPDQNIALADTPGPPTMRPPAEICSAMNDRFLSDIDTGHYFTLLIGLLDGDTGEFSFSQAGHPHPILQRRSGEIELLGQGGAPVGLLDGAEFEAASTRLLPGDRLLIYSDGVTECPRPDGELLDEDGLKRFLRSNRALGGVDLLTALAQKLDARTGEGEIPDDVSAILIERAGAQSR